MHALRWVVIFTMVVSGSAGPTPASAEEKAGAPAGSWKLYTNARFNFSVRYPPDWRLEEPLPDGAGVLLTPPTPKSQVGLTGFLNLVEGKSQDARQTLEEFATAHRRILGEHYGKKNIALKWQEDRPVTLGGAPAKQLSFSYQDDAKAEIIVGSGKQVADHERAVQVGHRMVGGVDGIPSILHVGMPARTGSI